MANKETVKKEENVVLIDDVELKESDMTDEQRYLQQQLLDLANKERNLNFQLDQVRASTSVFRNVFISSTKKVADEIIEEKSEEK